MKRVVIETMKEENEKRERLNNLVIYGVQKLLFLEETITITVTRGNHGKQLK